jgi:hypothetical protein
VRYPSKRLQIYAEVTKQVFPSQPQKSILQMCCRWNGGLGGNWWACYLPRSQWHMVHETVPETMEIFLEFVLQIINIFNNIAVWPFSSTEILCEWQQFGNKHSSQVGFWLFLYQVLIPRGIEKDQITTDKIVESQGTSELTRKVEMTTLITFSLIADLAISISSGIMSYDLCIIWSVKQCGLT